MTLLLNSYKVGKKTNVKLRGIAHLYNYLKRNKTYTNDELISLKKSAFDLFELVLNAERVAFGDNDKTDNAKRQLFTIQLDGISGEGNRFTPLGRVLTLGDTIKLLNRRLKFADTITKMLPNKDDHNCNNGKNYILIAGLPRTGSTMLHRLLSEDKLTRTPLWWEQMHDDIPLPTNPNDLKTDNRAPFVTKALQKISLIAPNALAEFDRFHKIGTYEVEECAPFMRRYFNDMDSPYLAPSAIQKRVDWCEDKSIDRSFIVNHLKAWLSLESLAFPKDKDYKWVIKAPLFTTLLPEFSEGFPNATYVFTNRDPLNVIPSTCGLIEVAAAIKADWKNEDEMLNFVGSYTLSRMGGFAKYQSTFIEKIAKNKNIKCLALRYPDVIKDPIKEVKRIYEFAGRELTDDTISDMEIHLKDNTQAKHGKANYSLEKYGLSKEKVEEVMKDYKKAYNI